MKTLKLYADVMHIDTKKFLVSVADPLNLTLQSVIAGESRQELGMALQGQLAVLRSKGFIPMIVYVDPQSAFWAMTQDFPGVEIDVGGAGDYVAKVDSRIRRIKETNVSFCQEWFAVVVTKVIGGRSGGIRSVKDEHT
jgi:hypothetical protein